MTSLRRPSLTRRCFYSSRGEDCSERGEALSHRGGRRPRSSAPTPHSTWSCLRLVQIKLGRICQLAFLGLMTANASVLASRETLTNPVARSTPPPTTSLALASSSLESRRTLGVGNESVDVSRGPSSETPRELRHADGRACGLRRLLVDVGIMAGKRDSQALLRVFMQGWRGKVCRERTSVEVDQRTGGQDVTVLYRTRNVVARR